MASLAVTLKAADKVGNTSDRHLGVEAAQTGISADDIGQQVAAVCDALEIVKAT